MKLCSGYYLCLKEYIPSCEKWNICLAKSLFVGELISFSFRKKWEHRKTVQSKSCCVIFIYRSIHWLRSPCSGQWSWGTTTTSPLPVAPVAIVITLSLGRLLHLLPLLVTSSFHLRFSFQTISEGFKCTRMGLWASLSVGATMKMLWSLVKQVSLTLKVNSPVKFMWSSSSNRLMPSSYSNLAWSHSTKDIIQQSPRSSVFFASSPVYVSVVMPSRCVARKSRSR